MCAFGTEPNAVIGDFTVQFFHLDFNHLKTQFSSISEHKPLLETTVETVTLTLTLKTLKHITAQAQRNC